MSISILLPSLSPSMETGNIVRWLKKEGDEVKIGDVIAEIETDKATMEIEAFDEGTLSRIMRPEGSLDVPVNEVIGMLTALGGTISDRGGVSDAALSIATAEIEPKMTGAIQTGATTDRVFASPLAKRIASEEHVDLSGLVGSGPRGRIVRRDVEASVSGRPSAHQTAVDEVLPEPARTTFGNAEQVIRMYEPGSYDEISLDGMRRTIASKVVEAKRTVPHFYLSIDCDADALLKLRGELNATQMRADAQAMKLTANDFIVKALAISMQECPEANVVWAEDRVLRFKHSDIAVAVAVDGGLYIPVVRRAETKSLSSISSEIKMLAERARAGKLAPEDYRGGSASISNLGMYGVSNFQPIINPPHAFILGIGAVEERLVSRNGQPTSIRAFTVTMSCDHRAMDGALAARLLATFKAAVQNPMRILV
ncbi:2-oxo acid dehydrogenase subunit E2 [Rhizobium sp. 1AS11]|uniref:2-oxo acid dehydrogenase subunit E2 n=1 Tax=Rhizobium acaciae TaxID=2989736 RepID=UPI0022237081|nr:2-oxo acid dehydrogenase subunit E2 [Rhizobium acaciae]MCW1411097.1 2-oxo acid dehydrogenase subunit E2 [Rhizobium acaciae]MCW1743051.1 2-oxo acid dehydrogenase subunit E2 [Rhizobium acaciae]